MTATSTRRSRKFYTPGASAPSFLHAALHGRPSATQWPIPIPVASACNGYTLCRPQITLGRVEPYYLVKAHGIPLAGFG